MSRELWRKQALPRRWGLQMRSQQEQGREAEKRSTIVAGPRKGAGQDPGRGGETTSVRGDIGNPDPETEGGGLSLEIGGGDRDPETGPANIRNTKRGLKADLNFFCLSNINKLVRKCRNDFIS